MSKAGEHARLVTMAIKSAHRALEMLRVVADLPPGRERRLAHGDALAQAALAARALDEACDAGPGQV